MHTLILLLVGPMQSWGYRSRYDDRDTALEPTRSGVIGLICAAMGIPRDGNLSQFDCLRMGVRIDAPGRLMTDFQTAMDVIKADGSGWDNVVSYRHYLSDARFVVGLESDNIALLEKIDDALRHPEWPLFLGRKSFVPSVPVYLPLSSVRRDETLERALAEFPYLRFGTAGLPSDPLRIVIEPRPGEEADRVQGDAPISFANRSFSLRALHTDWLQPECLKDGGVWPCTSQS